MRRCIKLLGISVIAVLLCALLGLSMLLAVFALPTDRINEHVAASVDVFEREGTYPILAITEYSKLDNWTDSVILFNAAYKNDSSLLDRALSVYGPAVEKINPVNGFISYYTEGENIEIEHYSRYWHGYLIFIKPLLFLFTYSDIRLINSFGVMAAAAFLIALMYIKGLKKYILPYLIALLLIDPFAISQSLQFSAIYYIYTIASVIMIWKHEWLDSKLERIVLFFVLVGCATSYFDFLTYPLVAFGIPAIFYLCMTKKSVKAVAKIMLAAMLAWFIGYVGMWSCKWIIGSILTENNVIANALNSIIMRLSMSTPTVEFNALDVLILNFKRMIKPALAFAVIYGIITLIMLFKRSPKAKFKNFVWIVYVIMGMLPIIWFVAASNHSYMHEWFTYRELIITAFAAMCLLARYSAKDDVPILPDQKT